MKQQAHQYIVMWLGNDLRVLIVAVPSPLPAIRYSIQHRNFGKPQNATSCSMPLKVCDILGRRCAIIYPSGWLPAALFSFIENFAKQLMTYLQNLTRDRGSDLVTIN